MRNLKFSKKIIYVLIWLVIWEIAGLFVGKTILLPLPTEVVLRFFELALTAGFWKSIGFSLVRIFMGFLLAFVLGLVFGALAAKWTLVRDFLAPFMATVKSIPVASFVILALVWIPSRNLSVFISFLIALPVIYTNVLTGILSTDEKLLQMAKVFRVSTGKKMRYIYLTQLIPYLESALSVAIGLCWKSGIAAEVIGIPKGSIGEKLYTAKIYLETPDLFAWTICIILVSAIFERMVMKAVHTLATRLQSV